MSFKSLALAGVLSLAAVPAFAYSPLTASLAEPVAKPVQVVAGEAVWNCAGSSCQAGATSDQTFTVSACHELVKQVGDVTGYTEGRDALRASELDRCNGHSARSHTQTASAR